VRDLNNEVLYFIIKIIDVTATKIEQENKLLIEENNKNRNIKLNTALYRLLADNSMHLVCLHDLNMTFQYVSIKAVIGYIKI
jgi:hypothetical protein